MRRQGLYGFVALLVAVGLVLYLNRGTSSPDPRGVHLKELKNLATSLVPSVHVIVSNSSEPHRDACDGDPSTAGWSEVELGVVFTSKPSQTHQEVAAAVAARLREHGWQLASTSDGPGFAQQWTLPGVAKSTALVTDTWNTADPGVWSLNASIPPVGHEASGC